MGRGDIEPDAVVLQNPSAELGLGIPNWTTGGGGANAISGRSRPGASGPWSFWGDDNGDPWMYQDVATSAYAVANALIDSGTVNIEVTWWGGTYYQGAGPSGSDEPKFTAIFYDSGMVEISQSTAGYRDCSAGAAGPANMRWLEFVETYDVPVNTRYVRFRWDFDRHKGTNNDAAVDDISVQFTYD